MKVWILVWKHSDNQAGGVVRSYSDQAMGHADLEMLEQHCYDKVFDLVESELQGATIIYPRSILSESPAK